MRPLRFGVLLSLAWLVLVLAVHLWSAARAGALLLNGAFEICDYVNYRLLRYPDCWQDLVGVAPRLRSAPASIAAVTLIPLALGWIIAGIVRMLLRLRRRAA